MTLLASPSSWLYFHGAIHGYFCGNRISSEGLGYLPIVHLFLLVIKPSVTSSGRGSYDWTFSKDVFDVEMPTKFLFPPKIDKSKILAELSVARPSFLGDEFPRPEGMNDDTFRALGRYMNVPKPVERREISTVGPCVPIGAMALNRGGKLAAVYTSKLLIIDSNTGALLNAISRLLPKPQSEIAYAKIVAGLLYFEFSEVLNEGKISKGKFKIAFEESIKARKLQSFEAERFFTTLSNLESNVDDSYRAKLLAEYYNNEFGMHSILLYGIEPGPRATIPRLLDKYMK
jgi:hypothetical protein